MAEKWEDFYELLEISRYSSNEEIRAAYIRKSKIFHTDITTGNKYMIQLLNRAYEVLKNSNKKKIYDAEWDIRKSGMNKQKDNTSSPSTSKIKRNESGLAKVGDTALAPINSQFTDYYKALNLHRETATIDDIKKIYLQILSAYQAGHLGKSGTEVLALVETAYGVLSNPDSKRKYDEQYDRRMAVTTTHQPQVQKQRTTAPAQPTTRTTSKPKREVEYVVRNKEEIQPRKPQGFNLQREQVSSISTTAPINVECEVISDTVSPVEWSFKGRKSKALIAYINAALISNKLRAQDEADLIDIKDLYGLFFDDYTFQFVYIKESIAAYYWLENALSKSNASEGYYDYSKTPWKTPNVPFYIGGQKALLIPADRIIPARILTSAYAKFWSIKKSNVITRSDLIYLQNEIMSIILSKPDLLDAYLAGDTPDDGSKKL